MLSFVGLQPSCRAFDVCDLESVVHSRRSLLNDGLRGEFASLKRALGNDFFHLIDKQYSFFCESLFISLLIIDADIGFVVSQALCGKRAVFWQKNQALMILRVNVRKVEFPSYTPTSVSDDKATRSGVY